jgi:hypothetical protein
MGDMPSSSSTSADASSTPSMAGATVNMVTMTTELFQTIMGQLASAAAPPTTAPGVGGAPAAQVANASDASIPVFVAPGATGTPSRESLLDNFPSVPRATILEIVRFEFHPLNLYKLDPVAQEKATDARNTMDIEDGHFTIRERTGTPKDYPTFASLLEPLVNKHCHCPPPALILRHTIMHQKDQASKASTLYSVNPTVGKFSRASCVLLVQFMYDRKQSSNTLQYSSVIKYQWYGMGM